MLPAKRRRRILPLVEPDTGLRCSSTRWACRRGRGTCASRWRAACDGDCRRCGVLGLNRRRTRCTAALRAPTLSGLTVVAVLVLSGGVFATGAGPTRPINFGAGPAPALRPRICMLCAPCRHRQHPANVGHLHQLLACVCARVLAWELHVAGLHCPCTALSPRASLCVPACEPQCGSLMCCFSPVCALTLQKSWALPNAFA